MKEYCNYKKIQGFWITDIPSHWKILKIKKVFKERVEKGFPNKPLLAATQTQGVIEKKQFKQRTVEAFKDLHLLKLALPGDFIISLRSFEGGIEYVWNEGIISPAYTILKMEKDFNRLYFKYLFKSYPFITLLQSCVTGIREGQNINYTKLSEHFIPIPNMEEQDKIVHFLDNKLANIDRLIAIKQRQIELLKEKCQAIINKVVTKGINPDVKMKDSGIEWIGEIPEDWENKKLGDIVQEQNIKNDNNTDRTVLSLSYGNIIKKLNVNEGLNPKDYSNYQMVHKGNIILRLTDLQNDQKSLRVGLANDEGIITSAYLCLKTSMDSKFIAYVLKFYDYIKLFYGFGAGVRQNMNFDDLKTIPIFIPSIKEQHMICEYIDKIIEIYSSLSDERIGLIKKSISLLHEYRIRLISDAVTGAIDVSNWKSNVSS